MLLSVFLLSALLNLACAEIIPFLYLNSSIDEGQNGLVRDKRQSVYYICGNYPQQYYSTVPCNQSEKKCSNGGSPLGIGCSNAAQCLQYFSRTSTCISGCCCTVPGGNPGGVNGYCYSGEPSNVRCSAKGQCPLGKTCMNGLCCTTTTTEWKYACGGMASSGTCSAANTCSNSFRCTASNYCCECPAGRSGGRCNNGQCAAGYSCQANGYCCASCPNNQTPYGACYNGECGGGRTCRTGNICC
uniref:EGF-like domain-containing protein n=1 Tax=Rhabditophanes sp. KR3021 TaxID=114890 RepID=A0AC35U5Q9_9BILA